MSIQDKQLTEKAMAAMQAAVHKVIEDHKHQGRPLALWEKGRVVMKTVAESGVVRENCRTYEVKERKGEKDA